MKKSLLLLMVLLFGLVFVGCKSDDRIVVRFTVTSGQITNAIKNLQFEQKFEAENPEIDVQLMSIEGSYDDIRAQTIMDINTGSKTAPDLVIGYPDHFAEYFGGGALVNLQPYIDNEEYGFTDEEMDDFLESYLAENRGFSSSKPDDLFGLPFNKSTEVLIYNKTAMEELFGDDWEDKIPATWDDLETLGLEIIQKVTAGELDNVWEVTADNPSTPDVNEQTFLKVSDYLKNKKFAPFGYDSSGNAFITLTRQWGGKYTERDSVARGYAVFNNAESKAMMNRVLELHEDGIFNLAPNFGDEYCSDALKAIRCILTVGSTAGVRYNLSDKYPYELGVAPIPYQDAERKYVIQQGTNICMLNVNSTEEELVAAWKFLKFMLSTENVAAFAIETGGYFPTRKSAFEDERYQNYLTNPTDDKKAYSWAAKVVFENYVDTYTYFVDPAFIGSSEIRAQVGYLFEDVLVNNADIDERYVKAYDSLYGYIKKNQ